MALPCLKQHAIARQALKHDLAGGGIQLPEATCLGEREPQAGHLTKLSAHTLNQSFHVTPHFQMRFADASIVLPGHMPIQLAKTPETPLSLLTEARGPFAPAPQHVNWHGRRARRLERRLDAKPRDC